MSATASPRRMFALAPRRAGGAPGAGGVGAPSGRRRRRGSLVPPSPPTAAVTDPGPEDLVQRLLEGVAVADPVAVVDQNLLQQRERVLPPCPRRTAAPRRAGRSRRPAGSAGSRTPVGIRTAEQVRSRADVVVGVERLLHLPRALEGGVARQPQDLDRAVVSRDHWAPTRTPRGSRGRTRSSALVSWKRRSSSVGRFARM